MQSFSIGNDHYSIDENGVVRQTDPTIVKYDNQYVDDRYNKYGELGPRMAYLRLGYLLGVIGYTPKTLLDVGYGNGDFLRAASDIIASVYGNDAPPMYPIDPIETVDNIFAAHYDIVCFFDALEHFEDPYVIKELKCDYVYISVPNLPNELNIKEFENWRHRRPNEHLSHFNISSLTRFFESINYKLISYSYIEDTIRKNNTQQHDNILSAVFKKV